MNLRQSFASLALAALLASCSGTDDGTVELAFIDEEQNLFSSGLRLSAGAQHLRAATQSGLVALDAQGQIVPALAERWNVTEEGRSFVFRLRDGEWPDGTDLTAESVRASLNSTMRELRGTSLGLDLAPITEVRAMGGRVIEFRLASAMPDLLHLLAQPELALLQADGSTGPMSLVREEAKTLLAMRPPQDRGLPEDRNWHNFVRVIDLYPMASAEAIDDFNDGRFDVVLGGRLAAWPLVDTGPLSRGTVRLDPAIGLFGMHVRRANGLLETRELREAIAMTIDRPRLANRFSITGWVPTTRVVAPEMRGDPGTVSERWQEVSIEDRRTVARRRIGAWLRTQGEDADEGVNSLSISLDEGPGLDLLFDELASQLRSVGITLVRAEGQNDADLVLTDRVARYASSRWFLNQFHCSLNRGLCSEEADFLVGQALDDPDPQRREEILAEAEEELTEENIYIPFGSPIRWSLIRGSVYGYTANQWGYHPLSGLAVIPR